MPELPEVESCRYHLERVCLHGVIVGVNVLEQGGHPRHNQFDEKVFEDIMIDELINKDKLKTVQSKYIQNLLHRKIHSINRKGKHMWLSFDTEYDNEISNKSKTSSKPEYNSCLFHFGMTGSIVIKDHFHPMYKSFVIDDTWPPRFTKLELVIRNIDNEEINVCFVDPRRFGKICLRNDPLTKDPIKHLATDITVEDIPSVDHVHERLIKKTISIKTVLLDQDYLFCGIGNWIADEVLYQSNIHPELKACNMTHDHITILIEKLRYILTTAMNCLYVNDDYPSDWLFNFRWEKKNKSNLKDVHMPSGHSVHFIEVGGRTTAFVPAVQGRTPSSTLRITSAESISDHKPDGHVIEDGKGKTPKKVTKSKRKRDDIVEIGDVKPFGPKRSKSMKVVEAFADSQIDRKLRELKSLKNKAKIAKLSNATQRKIIKGNVSHVSNRSSLRIQRKK